MIYLLTKKFINKLKLKKNSKKLIIFIMLINEEEFNV